MTTFTKAYFLKESKKDKQEYIKRIKENFPAPVEKNGALITVHFMAGTFVDKFDVFL